MENAVVKKASISSQQVHLLRTLFQKGSQILKPHLKQNQQVKNLVKKMLGILAKWYQSLDSNQKQQLHDETHAFLKDPVANRSLSIQNGGGGSLLIQIIMALTTLLYTQRQHFDAYPETFQQAVAHSAFTEEQVLGFLRGSQQGIHLPGVENGENSVVSLFQHRQLKKSGADTALYLLGAIGGCVALTFCIHIVYNQYQRRREQQRRNRIDLGVAEANIVNDTEQIVLAVLPIIENQNFITAVLAENPHDITGNLPVAVLATHNEPVEVTARVYYGHGGRRKTKHKKGRVVQKTARRQRR